jgi:hypothetical protein
MQDNRYVLLLDFFFFVKYLIKYVCILFPPVIVMKKIIPASNKSLASKADERNSVESRPNSCFC